jgi:hypothetical protein
MDVLRTYSAQKVSINVIINKYEKKKIRKKKLMIILKQNIE